VLFALEDPSKVLARSFKPILEPVEEYETNGFFSNVVFTNGHILDGDTLDIYYGASDQVICGVRMSVSNILEEVMAESVV